MKTTVIDPKSCPNCGGPLPVGALAGLCPKCLLAQGGDTDTGKPAGGRFTAPPVAELAPLFPQLQILGLLGAGGMGAVYKARQPALDRLVALKILPASSAAGASFEERFNREARALARLHHPSIVTVHEFGLAGALHYFIMEYVDGANLRQLEEAGRLSPREALQIIPQICDALQYAHDEGVVHRDIKPENVLVDRKGRVKIADFGLAKILGPDPGAARLTAEGQVMGTPHYMAPEQVERPLTVDHRADIYSLGVVLYEMLTGDLPLGKFPPPSRKVQIDVRFDEVVLRALENDPARRYQHASEVKSQVQSIADAPGTSGARDAGKMPETAAATQAWPVSKEMRWAGFPLVIERDGIRSVNRRAILRAVGILLGLLTIAFGLVTFTTGQTYFGWIGISGALSLQLRVVIAALIVAWGTWRAYRSRPAAEALPQTPQGTAILAPTRFSRKAVIGSVWAPLSVIAAMLWLTKLQADPQAEASIRWWQILLNCTVLPLGLAAPFATTILGWVAVGDIRRMKGRLSGLGLAVFDGLLFPILALDGFLVWCWLEGLRWMRTQPVPDFFVTGPSLVFVVVGAVALCGMVDFLVIRSVWRAVRLNATRASTGDWWWSTSRGALTIGLLCVAVIGAVGSRRSAGPGLFKNPPNQVAKRDGSSGAWIARLPGNRSVELFALADVGSEPDGWWRPDGSVMAPATMEIRTPGGLNAPNTVGKDLIFRFVNLDHSQGDASFPLIVCNPGTAYSTGNGVKFNGQTLEDAWPVRMAWPERYSSATLRVGVSLVPWRTVATSDPKGRSISSTHMVGDPRPPVYFHEAAERNGQAQLTVVRGTNDGLWQTRVVALDTSGVEHPQTGGTGTPSEINETWTYAFDLPLEQVKEFRAQIRPLHWVEFRDVALRSRGLVRHSRLPPRAQVRIASQDPRTGIFAGKLAPRGTVELLAVSDLNAAPNAWWSPAGEAIPDTLYETGQNENWNQPGRTNKSLIIHWRDLPRDAIGPALEFEPESGGGPGSQVLCDGKPLRSSRALQGTFPSAARQTSLRVGFAVGLWQKISTFDANGGSSTLTYLPEVPKLNGRIHQISEENGQVVITMILEHEDPDWNVRVMAVDTNNVEHGIATGTSTSAEKTVIWTYRFALKRAQLREFQVQVRPVHWVEFRDVALEPRDRGTLARSSRSLKPTAFGKPQEVHVTELFDFDNNKPGEFPTAADGTKTFRGTHRNPSWMRTHGFDVDAVTNALEMLQMQIIDLKADEWETLTVPEFEKKLQIYYGPPRLPSAPEAILPVTHGFRTADGAIGMLQILGFDDDKAGVQLRYKLVERAHFE